MSPPSESTTIKQRTFQMYRARCARYELREIKRSDFSTQIWRSRPVLQLNIPHARRLETEFIHLNVLIDLIVGIYQLPKSALGRCWTDYRDPQLYHLEGPLLLERLIPQPWKVLTPANRLNRTSIGYGVDMFREKPYKFKVEGRRVLWVNNYKKYAVHNVTITSSFWRKLPSGGFWQQSFAWMGSWFRW